MPPSKSYTHRAVIASSLSEGSSRIINPLIADDTIATIEACKKLGIYIKFKGKILTVKGAVHLKAPVEPINCKESASTIRFMTAIASLVDGACTLTGSPSLLKRPINHLIEALRQLGVKCEMNHGYPPVTVYGSSIPGGRAAIVGHVSSQFITALLFACPLAKKDCNIRVLTPLESKPYVQLTLNILSKHKIKIQVLDDHKGYIIPHSQKYKPYDHKIPGDFSSAAFLMAAAAITRSEVKMEGLSFNFQQPDEQILKILEGMGVKFNTPINLLKIVGGKLSGIEINAEDTPDLVPICAAVACYAKGKTVIRNIERLKIKESDRSETIVSELSKMGGKINRKTNALIIEGPSKMRGCLIDSHRDHRIAMSCTVAALGAEGETKILNAECVNKSYPNFFDDLIKLGGNIKIVE